MAIEFARLEYVSRSNGGNSCRKGAYNGRQRIYCEKEGITFDFSHEADSGHHEILLPEGASNKFAKSSVLWNAVEFRETRKNSQLAKELVLALPDDPQIALEDKVHLAKSFIQKHFVGKGLAAQIDIHEPHNKKDHNWHAHVLITTRRFTHNGLSFGEKARDLDASVRKGKVIEAERWGKLWRTHQNEYFEDKGLDLRVDPTGVVPQEHLGPVRMRARAFALLNEHVQRIEENASLSVQPDQILAKLTEKQSLFTKSDLESFLQKHVATEDIAATRTAFWSQGGLLQLIDQNSGEQLEKFTSTAVRDEENRIIRLADRIHYKRAISVRQKIQGKVLASSQLNDEQSVAYRSIFSGKRLNCIEGRAGTGKSHLLGAIREAYESAGYRVRGFAPTSEVAKDLEKRGFSNSENLHRFLFAHKHGSRKMQGREVWILDEAAMVGNRAVQEFLREGWKNGCQVILVGDSRQLPSIERGGMFEVFCQKYGAAQLERIQRQQKEPQREMASLASKGRMAEAVNQLEKNGGLHWSPTKQEAMENLVKKWDADQRAFPGHTSLIMEHRNRYAKVLNEIIHELRFSRGELGKEEFKCETFLGTVFVSEGDRLQFRANDRERGITNGQLGSLVKASSDEFIVRLDQGKEIHFNPQEFHRYQLGYAGTVHRSQGKTVDRAYALHSPWMNQNLFYVALTRHRKQFDYFVSKEEAANLSELKFQASRDGGKETTLSYQTDVDKKEKNGRFSVDQMWQRARENLGDFFHRNPDFYKVKDSEETFRDSFQVLKVDPKITQEEPKKSSPAPYKHQSQNDSSQTMVQRYLSLEDEVCLRKEVFDKEVEETGKELRSGKRFQAWQEVIQGRNQLAKEINKCLSPQEKKQLLTSKMIVNIESQAEKFSQNQKRLEKHLKTSSDRELYGNLNDRVEELCLRLFPEGPSHRSHKEWRFRSNRSLAVVVRGESSGSYYDFAEGEGGGLLQLIQKEMQLETKEAIAWANGFLEQAPQVARERREFESPIEKKWISLRPDPSNQPALQKGRGLLAYYTESARYAYRDAQEDLLYYVLRLESKEDPTKKITPPLSYGHYAEDPNQKFWRFKGLTEDKRTLYNLHLLKERPDAPILIVEGEKAADAAKDIFPTHIVMTWPGGANAVEKANWGPLQEKKIVIWPDNDEPGFKAADQISKELKKSGAKEISVVSSESLKKKFPEKWDLADAPPDAISRKDLRNLLKWSEKMDRGYAALFEKIYPQELKDRFIVERARFFDRMQFFEKILGKECLAKNGLEDPVYQAYQEFVNRQDQVKQQVNQALGLKGALADKVVELANVFVSKQNRMPLKEEMKEILEVIRQVEKKSHFENLNEKGVPHEVVTEMKEYSKAKVAEKIYDATASNAHIRMDIMENISKECSEMTNRIRIQNYPIREKEIALQDQFRGNEYGREV
ncbi:MAG: ATP-dependent RecD-like DNA helicase [Chlamydiae bacterium]|nr:ATP-dependent RecD-like DNA helicase [Chlamydiota bacterium]